MCDYKKVNHVRTKFLLIIDQEKTSWSKDQNFSKINGNTLNEFENKFDCSFASLPDNIYSGNMQDVLKTDLKYDQPIKNKKDLKDKSLKEHQIYLKNIASSFKLKNKFNKYSSSTLDSRISLNTSCNSEYNC